MSTPTDEMYEDVEIESIVLEKLSDAQETPGLAIEFDPDEADIAGAFQEEALSFEDALDGSIDLLSVI